MNSYELDPDVCPSSLNEEGEPMTEGETDHKWDTTTDPHTCSECGATREPLSDGELLDLLYVEFYKNQSNEDMGREMAKLLSEHKNG